MVNFKPLLESVDCIILSLFIFSCVESFGRCRKKKLGFYFFLKKFAAFTLLYFKHKHYAVGKNITTLLITVANRNGNEQASLRLLYLLHRCK